METETDILGNYIDDMLKSDRFGMETLAIYIAQLRILSC